MGNRCWSLSLSDRAFPEWYQGGVRYRLQWRVRGWAAGQGGGGRSGCRFRDHHPGRLLLCHGQCARHGRQCQCLCLYRRGQWLGGGQSGHGGGYLRPRYHGRLFHDPDHGCHCRCPAGRGPDSADRDCRGQWQWGGQRRPHRSAGSSRLHHQRGQLYLQPGDYFCSRRRPRHFDRGGCIHCGERRPDGERRGGGRACRWRRAQHQCPDHRQGHGQPGTCL